MPKSTKIILILAILIVVGGVIYLLLPRNCPSVVNNANINTNQNQDTNREIDNKSASITAVIHTSDIDTSSWYLYRNTKYGFSIKLPAGYQAINVEQGAEIPFDPAADIISIGSRKKRDLINITLNSRFNQRTDDLGDGFVYIQSQPKRRSYVVNSNVFSEFISDYHEVQDYSFDIADHKTIANFYFSATDPEIMDAILASVTFFEQ